MSGTRGAGPPRRSCRPAASASAGTCPLLGPAWGGHYVPAVFLDGFAQAVAAAGWDGASIAPAAPPAATAQAGQEHPGGYRRPRRNGTSRTGRSLPTCGWPLGWGADLEALETAFTAVLREFRSPCSSAVWRLPVADPGLARHRASRFVHGYHWQVRQGRIALEAVGWSFNAVATPAYLPVKHGVQD